MSITEEYIEEKFREFNLLMFEGRLKPVPVRLSRARTFLGQLRYRRERTPFGTCRYKDFSLAVSTRLDLTERQIEDTIIHEMIHYYILSNNITDTSSHGKVFRSMMHDINLRFGRNISVRYKPSESELDNDRTICAHFLCVLHFADGRVGVTLAAKTRIFELWDLVTKIPGVTDHRWFVTKNTYFNRFRRSTIPKAYIVDKEELERNMADAIPLARAGNTLLVRH